MKIFLVISQRTDCFALNSIFWYSLLDLDLGSRSQECEKAIAYAPIISQSFQSIWIEFGILLRLVDVKNLILLLSRPVNIQGRKCYLKSNVGLYSDICGTNLFQTWYDGRDHKPLQFFFIQFCLTLAFIQGHSCMRNQIVSTCSEISLSIWMKFSMLPQDYWLVEAHAKFTQVKVNEATQMFVTADYVREMTVKKSCN